MQLSQVLCGQPVGATNSGIRLSTVCSNKLSVIPVLLNSNSKRALFQRHSLGELTSRAIIRRTPTRISMSAVAAPNTSVSGKMAELKQAGKVAFIAYILAGDPNLETTKKAMITLSNAGTDVIELGIPYSDPLADGPTIQWAATRALEQKTTLDKVLTMLKEVSPQLNCPVVMFTYYNPIMRRGFDTFCKQIKDAGAAGLLVPDLPMEETEGIRSNANEHGIELVLLTTPTTPPERMQKIASLTQGFVYLVSVTGVTGGRAQVSTRVEGLVKALHEMTDKPVAVGFGVSTPEQAKQIGEWGAEGVIVGSALVKALGESGSPEEGLENLEKLAKSLKSALP